MVVPLNKQNEQGWSRKRCGALLGVVLSGTAGSGCASFSVYGYQYRVAQQFGPGEQPDAASAEARQLLGAARTIAFYPPDYCVNAESGETKSKDLRANCGVLLSTLERAAEHAGYEVLSWQNLRGPNKRPIDFARDANVDVLFEINEFTPGELSDSELERTLTFFERRDEYDDRPVQVTSTVAKTCRDYALKRDPPQTAALSGVIDIKTVAVSDGRDRWHYRKTLMQSLGREYPKVTFSAPRPPNLLASVLAALGSVAVGVGGGLAVAEAIDNPPPGQAKFDSNGWSTALLIGGGVGLAGALAVKIGMGDPAVPADEVLCREDLATPTPPVPAPPETVASEHTFHETQVADPYAKAREQIRTTMIAQFVDVLKEARGGRRAPAPVAPVAPAAPASPSPPPAAVPPAPPPVPPAPTALPAPQ